MSFKYLRFNSLERFIFRTKRLQHIYCYYIKLPFILSHYDYCLTHFDYDALFIVKLKKYLFFRRKPIHIANVLHICDRFYHLSASKQLSTKILLSHINQFFFFSKAQEAFLQEDLNLNPSKLHFIPFSIRFNSYDQTPKKFPSPSLEGLKPGYLLTIGSDQHRDIEAIHYLANRIPETILFITSNKLFLNHDFPPNVKVATCNYNQVLYYYEHCRLVFVPTLPNLHASGCTVIQETAALKKPIIASHSPGIETYITHNETGILIENNRDALVLAVKDLLANPHKSNSLAAASYNYAKTHFDTLNMSNHIIDILIN